MKSGKDNKINWPKILKLRGFLFHYLGEFQKTLAMALTFRMYYWTNFFMIPINILYIHIDIVNCTFLFVKFCSL